jgi:flavin reductase (DIM6/NTAB) family NADH-FMN oxidoreductase RutF
MTNGLAPVDARRFRDTIGLFATGVAIVVGRVEDEVVAMTVNAVSSVSLDPMLVLFCPGKRTKMAQRLTALSGFTVNILRHDQQALSTYFAGGWKEPRPPPFQFIPSRCGMRVAGSLASIECEPEHVADAGDHWLVLGRVLDLHTGVAPHRPLLFYRGRYHEVDFAAGSPAPDLTAPPDEPPHVYYTS